MSKNRKEKRAYLYGLRLVVGLFLIPSGPVCYLKTELLSRNNNEKLEKWLTISPKACPRALYHADANPFSLFRLLAVGVWLF